MEKIIYIYGVCDTNDKLNSLVDEVKSICNQTPKCEYISCESGERDELSCQNYKWNTKDLSGYDKLYNFKINIEFKDESSLFNAEPIIRTIEEECNEYSVASSIVLGLDTLRLISLKLMDLRRD